MSRGHTTATRGGDAAKTGSPNSAPVARQSGIAGMQRVHGNNFVSRSLTVQRKKDGAGKASLTPAIEDYLANPGPGEKAPGAPSDVRVHNDAGAHAATKSLRAKAMTSGRDVFFSKGRYQPGSPEGQRLLSHELAHVQQQRGASPGVGLVDNPALERDADRAAATGNAAAESTSTSGIQLEPEEKEEKSASTPSAGGATATATPTAPAGPGKLPGDLSALNLLPPFLRPKISLEDESDAERLNRLLKGDMEEADRQKGYRHKGPSPTAPASAPDAEPTSASPQAGGPSKQSNESDLIQKAKVLLAKCDRMQADKGDPNRKATPESEHEPEKDNGEKLKAAVEACLETPEGEAFTEEAKKFLLSKKGAPVTVGAVGALLGHFAATGELAYIPPIPLGDNAELSLEVKGPVDRPDQAMLILKVKDVEGFGSWLWGGIKTIGNALATFGGWIGSGFAAGGRGIAKAATWAGRGLATLGGWIWEGLKAVGGAFAKAGGWLWEGIKTLGGWVWIAAKWMAARIWDKVTGVLFRVVNWMLKLPVRVARLFTTVIEGVMALKPWSLDFWKSLGKLSTYSDLLKWLGTVLLEALEVGGISEIYETAMDFVKFNTRSLSGEELTKGKAVFGSTIPWHLVRVDNLALLGPSWTKRAYVSFHTINEWGDLGEHTLLHEMTHVWQYSSSGAIYMPQAIHAQGTKVGYNYGGVAGLTTAKASGDGFLSFNREQQGQIVADYYVLAKSQDPLLRTDLPLYAHFVKEVSSHDETHLSSLQL